MASGRTLAGDLGLKTIFDDQASFSILDDEHVVGEYSIIFCGKAFLPDASSPTKSVFDFLVM